MKVRIKLCALLLLNIIALLNSSLVKGASSNSAIVDQIYDHLGNLWGEISDENI